MRALPVALSEQDKVLGELHGAIAQLERRATTLLDHDEAKPIETPPQPPSDMIVEQIHSHNRAIEQATSRIRSVLARLHI